MSPLAREGPPMENGSPDGRQATGAKHVGTSKQAWTNDTHAPRCEATVRKGSFMTDLAELQHELSIYERERDSIVSAIHELRARARKKSIEAAATRSLLPETEIAFWRDGIARHQAELMATQARIAATNKALRQARAANSNKPPSRDGRRGCGGDGDVFLACFHTIAKDSLDPRQFQALEEGARALEADYQQMQEGSLR
jgi:hypothetical protein